MPRATVVVSIDDAAEVAAVDAWFDRWQSRLTHRSENHGCGCCVDVWEVEAPQEAIDQLPKATYAGEEWTNGG
jgi:hypothetical protein